MNCTEVQAQVHHYVDAELDAETRRGIDQHLWACAACTAVYAEQQALVELLQTRAPEFRAPDSLRARIVARLPDKETARPARMRSPGWWGAAAAASLAVVLTWGVSERQRAAEREDMFKDDAVTVHMRSLLENHLLDTTATQPARLENWFRQRLPYPVTVKDFSAQGFALAGARIDYLYAQRLAALVYRHGEHLINVLVWPAAPDDDFPSEQMEEGRLRVKFVSRGGTNFCIVSDLEQREFNTFTQLLTAA